MAANGGMGLAQMDSVNISASDYKFLELPTRDTAAVVAAEIIAAELDLAVAKYDAASFMVSGGSSPRPVYEALSRADITWSSVGIGLVDERWVAEGQPGSNASFIRESLLTQNAASATFLPMTSEHDTAAQGISAIHERYSVLRHPFDVALMGMGTDGHTASWFPGSDGLPAALDLSVAGLVSAIDGTGCAGAGDLPERISLTRAALMTAHNIILYITGDEKRAVFDAALKGELYDYPVRALLDAGPRLTVIWAP